MRAVLHLLLLGSLAKQTYAARRSQTGASLETELSTQVLLSSASLYLSKSVPADELSAVRANPTIATLENRGVSLEQLFGWLALSRHQQLEATKQAPSLVQITPLEVLGLAPTSPDDTDGVSPSVETEMRAGFISSHDNVDPATLQNYLGAFHRFRSWLNEQNEQKENGPLSQSLSHEQYEQYRRRQATIATGFFSDKTSVEDEHLAKAQGLLEESLQINSELDEFLSFLDSEDDRDWVHTHQPLGLIGTSVRGVQHYVGAFVHNTAELFRQTWRTFRHMMVGYERRCVAMQSDAERSEASRAGLTSGEEMLNKNGGEVDDAEVERQIQRTEQVLASLEQGEEETEAELTRDVEALRHAGDNLATSASSGVVDSAGLNATEVALDQVSGRVCKGSQHSMARRLSGYLRSLRGAVGSALAIALPGYGMRGLSLTAGLQGGFEEVIDFRNREIGYFRWATLDIGPSAVGLGVGAYAAVGWKGYKVNWTLQDAYQTAICTPHIGFSPVLATIPGINFFASQSGSLAGQPQLGISYCTDADNSGPVWLPEPHGANGVSFSAGFGVSLTKWTQNSVVQSIANGLPTDVQFAKYWMFTSECFDSLGSLLRAMYNPICGSCSGAAEHARVSTLKAATHVLAFPLITDMLHTFIAWQYDRHVRPEGYNPPCSDMSTNNRQDPQNIIPAVARNLHRAAETVKSIDSQINAIEAQLLEAVASNPDMTESAEWAALMREQHLCARHPLLPKCLAADDTELDLQEFADVTSQLNERSRDELVESCQRFHGISRCGWRSKENLVELLAVRASTFASEDEPFGLCRSDSDCPLPNQKCGHVHGVLQCKCLRGFCHRLDSEGQHTCSDPGEGQDAVRQVAREMRAYVQRARIDVGGFVHELQGITSEI